MFTGIVEEVGLVKGIEQDRKNIILTVECSFINELKVDQSISHNGACLTVTEIKNNNYTVSVIEETLQKSNLGLLKKGDEINLERSMLPTSRLDGHIVQGHVDQTAVCANLINADGSWNFTFKYEKNKNNITVEKGSICVNGVSLTVVNSADGEFSVAIIPYTFQNTNFKTLKVNSVVNLEFDIIGKYVQEYLRKQNLINMP